jgi:hypothetical protein
MQAKKIFEISTIIVLFALEGSERRGGEEMDLIALNRTRPCNQCKCGSISCFL